MPSLVWRGLWIGFAARRYPASERALARALWQMDSCKVFLRRLGATVRVAEGSEFESNAASTSALVAVSNHVGVLDPWILGSVMPVAFAAKAEMASWPVMGRICRNVGIVFVERGRPLETARFVDDVRQRMRDGVRVLVFPEGTTGDGIDLLPFKTGGFQAVAGMEDGGVLPVYFRLASVAGREATEEDRRYAAWPAGAMMASAMRALSLVDPVYEVHIGRVIATAGRDRKELAERARSAIDELASQGA